MIKSETIRMKFICRNSIKNKLMPYKYHNSSLKILELTAIFLNDRHNCKTCLVRFTFATIVTALPPSAKVALDCIWGPNSTNSTSKTLRIYARFRGPSWPSVFQPNTTTGIVKHPCNSWLIKKISDPALIFSAYFWKSLCYSPNLKLGEMYRSTKKLHSA